MTKSEAMVALLKANGGSASWRHIYENIEKYYPAAKVSKDWEAGLRGVLYRDIRNGKNFKRIGLGTFALADYQEEKELKAIEKSPVRMHSYIEGLLVELGNHEGYSTFCADPSAQFQSNISISELTTIKEFPEFTYPAINAIARKIDVIWFAKNGYQFPKKLFEVVDSIGTLGNSLSRMYQLNAFQVEFIVVAPEEYHSKIEAALSREPYSAMRDRFVIHSYEQVQASHHTRLEFEKHRI